MIHYYCFFLIQLLEPGRHALELADALLRGVPMALRGMFKRPYSLRCHEVLLPAFLLSRQPTVPVMLVPHDTVLYSSFCHLALDFVSGWKQFMVRATSPNETTGVDLACRSHLFLY